jgi:hypothetical protein
VFSSIHGDYFRALAGAKSVSKQIEYMKEYGSAAPVLTDFNNLSDLEIMGDIQTSELASGSGSESGSGSIDISSVIMVSTADDCSRC